VRRLRPLKVWAFFLRAIWRGLERDPQLRGLGALTLTLILTGTVAYSLLESWSLLDAVYFSVVVITTVGMGPLEVESAGAKVFTIFYLLIGIGVIIAFGARLVAVASDDMRRRVDDSDREAGPGR
jgi:voltage-gated potassium channel